MIIRQHRVYLGHKNNVSPRQTNFKNLSCNKNLRLKDREANILEDETTKKTT